MTLEEDLFDDFKKFQVGNVSALCEELLMKHFAKLKGENLKILKEHLSEKERERKVLNREIRQIKQKIIKIEEREVKVLRAVGRSSPSMQDEKMKRMLARSKFRRALAEKWKNEEIAKAEYYAKLREYDSRSDDGK